jgi:uncharacterized membrane protein YdbT with pleckstrin-like domain
LKPNDNDQLDFGKVFFNWKFSEFTQHQRNRSWYVWGGIIVGALLIFSVFTFNFLFGLIIIMTSLTVLLFARSTNEIDFMITEDGVVVNEKLYEYKSLKNFFIIYEPPQIKTLYFEPKNIFIPRIPVDLQDQNPVKIREVLLNYLPEDLERENEPVSEQFSRIFKI